MTDDVKDWLRDRASKIMVIGTGLLLALAVFSLVSALGSDGSAEVDAQAQGIITDLDEDLATAQEELTAKHSKLLSDLPGMDLERVARDQATGRTALLTLTDSSATGESVLDVQRRLDSQYTFLDEKSRTLTEFIPEWMAATGAGPNTGSTYMVSELNVSLSSVQGLDYTYTGLARLDPVSGDSSSTTKSEFVIFTFSTRADGNVTSLESYRASSSTRDSLLAAEQEATEGKSPESSATTPPSDGG